MMEFLRQRKFVKKQINLDAILNKTGYAQKNHEFDKNPNKKNKTLDHIFNPSGC